MKSIWGRRVISGRFYVVGSGLIGFSFFTSGLESFTPCCDVGTILIVKSYMWHVLT